MASPGGTSGNADLCPDEADFYVETNDDIKRIILCKNLLTKVESGFAALMKVLFQKTVGIQAVIAPLKILLKCGICQELIIQAISRKCTHTFCLHCFADRLQTSTDCPTCGDDCYAGARNLLVDGVTDLFVQLSFTEEQKVKRSNSVKQRPISSPVIQGKAVIYEPNLDSTLIGRLLCFLKAQSLFLEVLKNDGIRQLLEDDVANGDMFMLGLCTTFVRDTKSMFSMLSSLSFPLKVRYLGIGIYQDSEGHVYIPSMPFCE